MPDYEALRLIWWLLLGVLLIGFAVTDGFDLGVAAIFRFVGRSHDERDALIESIEPVWEGNQVWLVLGAGAAFAAWPMLYAAAFSSFYFAMFLLLAALIVRPVGFAFRGKVDDRKWRAVWDWVLCVAGLVSSFLFGVAFGNLFVGVAYHLDALSRPVFTGGFFSLLHPFALLCGAVSLSMLVMHGASYAAMKVEAPMGVRAARIGRIAALVVLAAFTVAGLWVATGIEGLRITSVIDGNGPSDPLRKVVAASTGAWLDNYRAHPGLWLAPLIAYAGALGAVFASRAQAYRLAFIASGIAIAAIVLTAGIGLFPFLLPSATDHASSLTVWDASSSRLTLSIMLIAVAIFLPLILLYTTWVFRVLRGQVTLAHVREQRDHY
ncbi:MAG TPA: cytochrome d ubiquinol oxidase subunit II [Steroidobacteraceae bacterium]|nr:cytochrome d ubiquinol oxidase subunit II [Steroidobacteraceae bacterium]